jgi:hypothetical protein
MIADDTRHIPWRERSVLSWRVMAEDHTGLSGAVSNVEMYRAMLRVQESGKRFDFIQRGGGGGTSKL